MKDPTVRGVVHVIEETKTFGRKGFRKRLVVLEQSKGTFTNFIPVDFVKDGCDEVDDLSVGDEIEVTCRLSGRRWQRDEASEVKYFLSAERLSFKRLSGTGRSHDGQKDTSDPNDASAAALAKSRAHATERLATAKAPRAAWKHPYAWMAPCYSS